MSIMEGGSGGDLLSDTLMMDDFAPDIDLLDDILGVDYDWKELEPSLHQQQQQQLYFASVPAQLNNNFQCQELKPLLEESGQGRANLNSNSEPQHHSSIPYNDRVQDLKPFTQLTQPVMIPNFSAFQNSTTTPTQPQYIQPAPPTPPAPTPAPPTEGAKILTQILPNPIQNQIPTSVGVGGGKVFSFATGFCQPVFATATSTANGQTIILPQLQLALVQEQQQPQQQDKLPMKRLSSNSFSNCNSSGGGGEDKTPNSKRSKNKEQTSRRSSHNAIERRYRSSINDKIIELKSLVCHNSNDTEKVHKAAVLRSSIDTIRYYQNSNSRLEKENKSLKSVLHQVKKCTNCGAEQPIAVFGSFAANSNADLRELLTSNSPPPTDHSSESSNPSTPNSVVDMEGGSGKGRASPIALFAVAAGLFLINPGVQHGSAVFEEGSPHHSRVPRSLDYTTHTHTNWTATFTPKLIAMTVNLALFMFIYFLSGKLFTPRFAKKMSKSKHTPTFVHAKTAQLVKALKLNSKSSSKEKHDALESLIHELTGLTLPTCNLSLKFQNYILLLKTPFMQSVEKCDEDVQIDYIVGRCFAEIGKLGQNNQQFAVYCGFCSLKYAFNCVESRDGQNLLISGVLLTKSKLVLKSLIMKIRTIEGNTIHPLLGVGLGFFRGRLRGGGGVPDKLTTCMDPHDPVSTLLNCYKYEMMWNGVSQMFYYGEGAVDYFKNAVRGVIAERRSKVEKTNVRNRFVNQNQLGEEMETDLNCEWWACVLWSQAEWSAKGGRGPILQRLYKVVDSLWKYQSDDPLAKAVYFTHLAKRRLLQSDSSQLKLNSARKLVDSAGDGLRDAINLTTDIKPVIQLIWTLTAEWILEIRLQLWEEMGSHTDVEFTRQFSRDLDTLRSLTHYVPSSLPSVYLYEASMRLMTKASPGRTQLLLDASLRSVRLSQRSGLSCSSSVTNSNLTNVDREKELVAEAEGNCNKKKSERNLIREKRKAIALYLRCKHLPSQVMTCPGEKAGMLREALKCLEVVGDYKKINECLDMIKSLHSVALY